MRHWPAALLAELRYARRHPALVRWAWIGGVTGLVCALIVAIVWAPVWIESRQWQGALDARRQQLLDARQRVALAAAVQQAAKSVESIDRKLNAPAVQVTLVSQVGRIARERGVRVLAASFEDGKPQAGYQPLQHELTVEGSYPALRRFLADLYQMPTFTLEREAVLVPVSEGAGVLRMQLRLTTYRRPGGGGRS
jgi:Tfp pilus assembly protein PilO